MSRVPRTEKTVVGADLNGHVQKKSGNYLRKSLSGKQKKYMEPPKERNTWRGRPGGGVKRGRRA